MTLQRKAFKEFLLRISRNEMLADDWQNFAVQFYVDEELEGVRRSLVEKATRLPELQVGWIPRFFQSFAQELSYSECLQFHRVFYRPELSGYDENGLLSIRASWWDDNSHSCGYCEFPKDHPDYEFWGWVIEHRARGVKGPEEVERLREEFRNRNTAESPD